MTRGVRKVTRWIYPESRVITGLWLPSVHFYAFLYFFKRFHALLCVSMRRVIKRKTLFVRTKPLKNQETTINITLHPIRVHMPITY